MKFSISGPKISSAGLFTSSTFSSLSTVKIDFASYPTMRLVKMYFQKLGSLNTVFHYKQSVEYRSRTNAIPSIVFLTLLVFFGENRL